MRNELREAAPGTLADVDWSAADRVALQRACEEVAIFGSIAFEPTPTYTFGPFSRWLAKERATLRHQTRQVLSLWRRMARYINPLRQRSAFARNLREHRRQRAQRNRDLRRQRPT